MTNQPFKRRSVRKREAGEKRERERE